MAGHCPAGVVESHDGRGGASHARRCAVLRRTAGAVPVLLAADGGAVATRCRASACVTDINTSGTP